MISDFVDVRGGGLLLLGGPHAFAEGGYAGTPVAEVMPVVIERSNSPAAAAHVKVRPTRAGEAHAVTQLGDTEEASADRWKSMPPLTALNMIQAIKPGATVLLSGTDERRRERVVLAYQRYGRGKSIAFPVHDSWQWQMHASIRVDDQTHENFWRQLLRWLVDGVPDAVGIAHAHRSRRARPAGHAHRRRRRSALRRVERRGGGRARIVTLGQNRVDVPLQWTGERSGQYRAIFDTSEPGWYQAKLEATRGGKPVGTSTTHVRAVPDDAEYFDAAMHAPLLKRIAQETGGRFYTADKLQALPEDLKYSGKRRHRGRGARALAHADPAARAVDGHLHGVGSKTSLEAGVTLASLALMLVIGFGLQASDFGDFRPQAFEPQAA